MEIRRAQAEDWLADLASFNVDVVNEACARWRIKETRRPVIADIFKLCEEVAEMRQAPAVWTLPPPPDAVFPSRADRDYLCSKVQIGRGLPGVGYAKLSDDEKWRWHAYDYAFRRVFMSDETSPIDPVGQYRDPAAIALAERIYYAYRMA